MKTKKILSRVAGFLDKSACRKGPDRTSLKKLLKHLKEKEEDLTAKLDKEKDDAKAAKLKKKIKLLRAQRKKGGELLKQCD